jgi:DNA-binding NarL/FixJ family response regulator
VHSIVTASKLPRPSLRQGERQRALPVLTTRETAVLAAVARGEANREIGTRLGIKEQTVKNHVSVLIEKFHVRNRVQLAVVVALEMPELLA